MFNSIVTFAGELLNIRGDSVIKVYSLIFEEEGFQSAIHVDHQIHWRHHV